MCVCVCVCVREREREREIERERERERTSNYYIVYDSEMQTIEPVRNVKAKVGYAFFVCLRIKTTKLRSVNF